MQTDAPFSVLKGTAVLSGTGAVLGATYGFAKRSQNVGSMAFASGFNCAIAGTLFFSLREYAVTPLLRQRFPSNLDGERTLHDIRMHRMIDTTVSGALAGAGLNSLKRGPVGLIPGAVTAALFATAIQFGVNELQVARIRYVSSSSSPFPAHTSTPRNSSSSGSHEEPPLSSAPPPPPKSSSERILDFMSWISPVKKLTDEEYLILMEKRRVELEKRMGEVKDEIEANKAMGHSCDKK